MGNSTRATLARRLKFTPELLANVRQRFEQSDEPLSTMAADLGCCKTTLHGIAKRAGWLRYVRPPRDLTSAARLHARAEKLAEQGAVALSLPHQTRAYPDLALSCASRASPTCVGGGLGRGVAASGQSHCRSATTPTPNPSPHTKVPAPPKAAAGGGGEEDASRLAQEIASPPPDCDRFATAVDLPPPGGGKEEVPRTGGGESPAETAEQLHAAVVKELAEFKVLRAQLKGQPLGLLERERAARTLANLTATLHRLQTLRCGVPLTESHTDNDYDDMPADLDEFRDALARRIETFLASRPDEGDSAQAAADPVDEAGA